MNWELVASSAVAAGIVSAVANGLLAWRRSVAEAKERRIETKRGHMREVVTEFLAADQRR